MKPLRSRLEDARKELGINWQTLEKDYILSWVLAGISQVDLLRRTLVFKGGTALKKCYFGRYRFSEDLDFSATGNAPVGEDMERAVRSAVEQTTALLDEYAPVSFDCESYLEKQQHPTGQEAFTVRARLPWQSRPLTSAMIEISMDESILWPVSAREVIHEYGEPLEAGINVYSLEEIIAEKMRAILQHTKRLEKRRWVRSRARDYYDLWQILNKYRTELNLSGFPRLFSQKCDLRDVSFERTEDFFQPQMLDVVKGTWEEWLGPLVVDLPAFDTVLAELRTTLPLLLGESG